jgi:RNA polymerase sigma-70 factor (ECF subfamily)
LDDVESVAAVRSGDREAFRFLVERHQHRLYGVLRRMTGDPGLAEELTQESFVRAFRGLRSFRGDSSFGTWLVQIAIHAVRDSAKHERKRSEVPLEDDQMAGCVGNPLVETRAEYDPFERLAGLELESRLEGCISHLPPLYREAFTLKVVEDLDYDEIAQLTGDNVGSLKVRVHRARGMLRERLSEDPHRPGRVTEVDRTRDGS